jgi:hypothetical protein
MKSKFDWNKYPDTKPSDVEEDFGSFTESKPYIVITKNGYCCIARLQKWKKEEYNDKCYEYWKEANSDNRIVDDVYYWAEINKPE